MADPGFAKGGRTRSRAAGATIEAPKAPKGVEAGCREGVFFTLDLKVSTSSAF